MSYEQVAEALLELQAKIRPILAGKDPAVVSLVLAGLTATLIRGHSRSDPAATLELRRELLRAHCAALESLVFRVQGKDNA